MNLVLTFIVFFVCFRSGREDFSTGFPVETASSKGTSGHEGIKALQYTTLEEHPSRSCCHLFPHFTDQKLRGEFMKQSEFNDLCRSSPFL
jgi:hypothetical protein